MITETELAADWTDGTFVLPNGTDRKQADQAPPEPRTNWLMTIDTATVRSSMLGSLTLKRGKTMSVENTTYAFQNAATTGEGLTQFFSEPTFTTFRITGNGSVSAGAVTIECCPGNAPMTATPTPGSGTVWTALTTITVPANATIKYQVNDVVGSVRARISTPVTGGTVTVTAVRPEEQRGVPLRPSRALSA